MFRQERLIPFLLDLKYTLRAARVLLRFPLAIPRLLEGPEALDRLLQEEYAKNPVGVKRTHGFDIHLDTSDMGISPSIGVMGWYELRTTELFTKLLGKGARVVDVGANIGFFTLLSAKISGPEGVVLSFEPEPASFSLLSRSVKENGFSNIKLYQQCVSNVDGTRILHLSVTRHKGLHSIARDLGGSKIVIPSKRLDTIAKELKLDRIDLLKVDAEGSEPDVLEGAKCLLEGSQIRQIIMEWDRQTWAGHQELLKWMLRKFEAYQYARSLPFIPPIMLTASSVPNSVPHARYGVNLYLRLRA